MTQTTGLHLARFAPRPPTARAVTLAGIWSAVYAVVALWWAAGGAGYPLGLANDPDAALSILGRLSQAQGAAILAAIGVAGTVAAAAMMRPELPRPLAAALATFGWAAAIGLTVVLPDYRPLVIAAYAPVFFVGLPFGWPPGVSLLDAITWPVIHQAVLIAGGLLWAAATVDFRRRTRNACPACGRDLTGAGRGRSFGLAAWGRPAVAVAVALPLLYAASRWAWLFGIPLGISAEELQVARADGMLIAGAGLGSVAIAGALLTTGLVMRWGEVFPDWLPLIRGRPVPIRLATVPALLVAVILIAGGLTFIRLVVSGGIGEIGIDALGAMLPVLLMPAWGAALAIAALAYRDRRRGPCPDCGGRD